MNFENSSGDINADNGTRPTATKRKGAKTTAVVDAPRRSNRLQRSDSVTGSAVDAAKANGGDSGVRRRRVTRTRKTLEQTDPNIILTSDGDIQGAEVQDSATTQQQPLEVIEPHDAALLIKSLVAATATARTLDSASDPPASISVSSITAVPPDSVLHRPDSMASMSTSIVCNDRIRDTEPSVSSSSRDGDTTSSSAVLTAPMAAVPQQLQDQHASAVASSVEMPVHQTVRRRSSARTGPTKQRASVTAATTANDASVHSKLLCSPVRCACVRHGKSGHIRDTIPSGCTSNDDTERSDDLHTEHCTTDDSLADLASATLPQHVCEPCAASPQRVCELGLQSGAGLSSEHQSAALLSSILASGNITASSTDLPPSKSSTVPWLSVVALTNPSPCNVASVTDTVDWAMVSPTARDRRLFRRWLSAVLFIAVLLMGTLYADAIRAGLVSTMRSPLMQQHASELQRMVHTLSTATKMGADHARTWLAPYSEMLVGFWLRYHRDVLSFLTQ